MNRRDFLKLASLLPIGLTVHPLTEIVKSSGSFQTGRKNVIIIVFDAWSAYNMSLYGYRRETTPNIARLAKKAVVYHNHFAGGNFTTPGTASLLTGVLPWTHRAFNPKGQVIEHFVTRNIFSAFHDYFRIAYTHNGWANIFLHQFEHEIDELIPREQLILGSDKILHRLFENDDDTASLSWLRNTNITEQGYAYSLFISHWYQDRQNEKIKDYLPNFPRGLPTAASTGTDGAFLLEQAVDYIKNRLTAIPQPFLAYFHFLPPHDPYRTPTEFFKYFANDGYTHPIKPVDVFTVENNRGLLRDRQMYDEFILYIDREFARLYDSLKTSGLLDNTLLLLTSDHGEMHERGISGHSTKAFYQPVIRIPLLIFEPNRDVGTDIYENTSAIDVLPTLTHLTGQPISDWVEGTILPPYSPENDNLNRTIYAMRSKNNPQYSPLSEASTTLVQDNYKLLYYFGYPEIQKGELIKLFDIQADPEEMIDLYPSKKQIAMELLDELKTKLAEADQPYL